MADRPSGLTLRGSSFEFACDRVAELLDVLERMAGGDTGQRLRISPRHDELDAVAHGINVLVGELGWASARLLETQKERAVSAERVVTARNAFIRNMSHEIRTPLTAMLGCADLLASTDLVSQDRKDLLQRLQANGRAVVSLLDDLLDWARLDADRFALVPESVSVVELVGEVLASLEFDSRSKGLAMRVEAEGEALGSMWTDRYRLRQILVNLAANAVKFTEAGIISVSLRATGGQTEGEWTIDIADTGVGIAPEEHQHLFEPFAQANASITRVYGGSGLGLALSRRLAEQLGGSLVLLHSAPGEGTAFRLRLRNLQEEPKPEVGSAAEPPGNADALRGSHVLLAEDHRDLHFAVRRLLERAGATVTSAHDGQEAVAKAESDTFDVVLMDLRMPHMDGLEATRILRSRGYIVPIVALTADPAALRIADALDAGCDVCLSKPFKLADVAALVRLRMRQADCVPPPQLP